MASLDPLGQLIVRRARKAQPGAADSKKSTARDLRLPKPGDILVRHYKGQDITVRVLEDGFEYQGRRFRSLSAVAKVITGAHWNGLLFFNLVRQER